MSMEILEDIIDDFASEKFTQFFREKSRSFAPRQESFAHYDGDFFIDGLKIGDQFRGHDTYLIKNRELSNVSPDSAPGFPGFAPGFAGFLNLPGWIPCTHAVHSAFLSA